jgi:UDP-4-amino-4,6-dideoxy-N-acetyl-beta-L-altrosamine transaminase
MKPIPYARQSINKADIDAVVEVLCSDWLTQGPAVDRFERSFAAYCGVPHAIAVHSATAALHLACLGLGLEDGQRLWTSANTFVASANCGRYCGAEIDFVDIDRRTGNMSIEALTLKLEHAQRRDKLPHIVVPVHFSGQPCDMPAIAALARRYGFRVIEDASHAVGAEYHSGRVGNCAYSDATVFSFHPVKIITTGEGGMVVTGDTSVAQRLRLLRTHGITREPAQMQPNPDGPWYYEQVALGFNYRMTDIQAALGASQLSRVGEFLDRRRRLAGRYDSALSSLPLRLPFEDPRGRSAWHLYVVQVDAEARRRTFERMRARGIQVNVHYIPLHLHPYYRARGFRRGDFPEAERFYEEAISLPLFPDLSDAEQDRVCEELQRSLVEAGEGAQA